MKQLYNTIKTNEYAKSFMIGKYIYMKRSNKEMDIYYIFNIKNIIEENPVIYKTNKCFYFCVPFNKERKCFCYDDKVNLELKYSDILYELSYEEWIDTFRSFVDNEGKYAHELPDKIIKDKK